MHPKIPKRVEAMPRTLSSCGDGKAFSPNGLIFLSPLEDLPKEIIPQAFIKGTLCKPHSLQLTEISPNLCWKVLRGGRWNQDHEKHQDFAVKTQQKDVLNMILSTETFQWAMTEKQNTAVLQQLQNPALRAETAQCPCSCGFPACCLDKIN